MNFAQKFGIFCLAVITFVYVYFAFFTEGGFEFKRNLPEVPSENISDIPPAIDEPEEIKETSSELKKIKIFVTDSKGNVRPVVRQCDTSVEKSCLTYAISEMIKGPSSYEKKKGLSSEVPSETRILSIREGKNNVLIDLSPAFESGGGAESTYIRIHQLIKTAKANTNLPVFLYINGKQADVIGGEGIMIKQPLTEKSLDD